MTLALHSPVLRPASSFPERYTCDGEDVSPPLGWSNLPAGTQSLVVVLDDLDLPGGGAGERYWVNWIVYDIPVTTHALAEDAARRGLPVGALTGTNSSGRTGYSGPCPDGASHRYRHRLFALDCVLADLKAPAWQGLERAIAGHVLDEAELVCAYARTSAAP